ncbi:MAG: ABC transporter ATP-binding protein [Candidatus Thorarchaeota archaeon]
MDDITITELTKNFDDLIAVNDMNLEVEAGSIFGLLGPNGAGKSTTTRILSTLLKPAKGTAKVAGHDILQNPVEVRQNIGVLPEEGNHTLYPTMSAYENLEYFAKLYGVPQEEIEERIKDLLEFMDLWERRSDKAGELSTGNRQRLALCRAMLHNPTVLLLDEPTSALDPVASKRVRELILRMSKKYDQTFFINSHNLGEVQRICDSIAIIDEGKILLTGRTEELRRTLYTRQIYRIVIRGDLDKAESITANQTFVKEVTRDTDSLIVEIEDPLENNSNLMRALLNGFINVVEFAEEEASLEDLYLQVIKGGM